MAISDCASHHISDPLWHMRTSVHVYHAFPGARAYPRARARLCVWRLPLARLLIEPVTALYSTLLLALVVAGGCTRVNAGCSRSRVPGPTRHPRARARLCVWRLPLARLLIEPVTALYLTPLLALVVAAELLAAAGNGVYLPCLSPPSSQLRNKAKRALQHEL